MYKYPIPTMASTNRIVLSGTYPVSDIIIGQNMTVSGLSRLKGAIIQGVSDTGIISTNRNAVSFGHNTGAGGNYAFAAGVNAEASHDNSFVWNGNVTTETVSSSGAGTFTINPVNGENGFFIGSESLGSMLQKKVTKASVTPEVDPETGIGTCCKVTYNENGLIVGASVLGVDDIPETVTNQISENTTNIAELTRIIEEFGKPIRIIGKSVNPIVDGVAVSTLDVYYMDGTEQKVKTVTLRDGDLAIYDSIEHLYMNGSFTEVGDESKYIAHGQIADSDIPENTVSISKIIDLQSSLDSKVDANEPLVITGTKCKITYDAKGLVTGGDNLSADDLPSEIPQTKIKDLGTTLEGKVTKVSGITSGTFCKVTTNADGLVTSGESQIGTDDVSGLGTTISTIQTNITNNTTAIANRVEKNSLDGETIDIQTATPEEKEILFLKIAKLLGAHVTCSINNMNVVFGQTEFVYTGSPITPSFEVKDTVRTVPSDKYTSVFSNNVNVGTARVDVTADGEFYTGSVFGNFTIVAFNGQTNEGSRLTISDNTDTLVYNGTDTPSVIISISDSIRGESLVKDTDFSVVVENVSGLTYKLKLHYIGNYTDTDNNYFVYKTFTVRKFTISSSSVSATYDHELTWNGESFTPPIALAASWGAMTENTHYTVSYQYNTSVNDGHNGQIIVTGIGNCDGSATFEFVKNPLNINTLSFTPIADQYLIDGKAEPDVEIINGKSQRLVKNVDYTLTYVNNTSAGEATVHIDGINNYSQRKTMTFIIKESLSSASIAPMPKFLYTGEEIRPEPAVTI